MDDIKARKFSLMEKLIAVSDEQVIQYLEQIFAEIEQEHLTSNEIEGVKEALEQAKNGEVYSEKAVRNRFAQWLKQQ